MQSDYSDPRHPGKRKADHSTADTAHVFGFLLKSDCDGLVTTVLLSNAANIHQNTDIPKG